MNKDRNARNIIFCVWVSMVSFLLMVGCSSAEKVTKTPVKTEGRSKKVKELQATAVAPEEATDVQEEKVNHSDLGDAIKEKNFKEVVKISMGLLAKDPNDIKALNILAMVNLKEGRPELSKIYLGRALKVNEKSVESLSNLAAIQWSQGKKKEALRTYKKAMQINSDDPYVAGTLGQIYAQAKDYKKAKVGLELAYKNDVRTPAVLSAYAVSLVATGEGEKAEDYFEEVVDTSPNDVYALTNLAIYQVEEKKDFSAGDKTIGKIKYLGVPTDLKQKIDGLETKVREVKK